MLSLHPRVRIILILVASFVASGCIMHYTEIQHGIPRVQLQLLATDFSRSGSSLLASIQSISLPNITTNQATKTEQEEKGDGSNASNSVDTWVRLPSSTPVPTSHYVPTTSHTPIPTRSISAPSPTKRPTVQPTQKPTDKPGPTPTSGPEPVTGDIRPGSNLDEVYKEVEKRMCVPAALMKAIKTIETGQKLADINGTAFRTYNTFNWWNGTVSLQQVCGGFAYSTNTGYIPSDSAYAGQKCAKGIGTDQKIMGLMQISEWEQTVSRKNTTGVLPNNIDRRVLFDNLIIFASITKNRVGSSPKNGCSDWPEETVKLAAEKHHGACKYDYGTGNAGDYCQKAWDLYQQYK